MKYGFILDNRKCIGCHACTVACKSEHSVPIGVNRTWVKYIEKGTFPDSRRYFTVMRCNHCENPPCVDICPVGALFQREDGIVDFNNQRCIGCKSCTQACPYDSLYIDPNTMTAAKCNFCAHRIDQGLNPACVNVCPEEAIICGDMDDPSSAISKLMGRNQLQTRKAEKGTTPKLYYINSEASALHPMAAPPTNQYQQFSQAAGVGHYAKYAEKRIVNDESRFLHNLNSNKADYEKESLAENGVFLANAGGQDAKLMKGVMHRTHDAPSKGPQWGWELPAYLWSKAISAGLFIITAAVSLSGFKDSVTGNTSMQTQTFEWFNVLASFGFLILTTIFLIKDLDKPSRFLYVILRPQFNSWLTRGGYILSTFGFFLALWILGSLTGVESLITMGYIGGLVAGIVLGIYTGFLLAQAKGRDFWQSPMLPLHMLIHTVIAGSAFLIMTSGLNSMTVNLTGLLTDVLTGALFLNLIVIALELKVPHPTTDAKLTVGMIVGKKFGLLFYGGSLLIGHVIPLIILSLGISAANPAAAALAGLCVLTGMYITEHIWVRAPQLVALS
ncbi:MAG: polysulfide reductase NrfD [Spirochaetia bacterium]|nr:polysulfide reductase NrfD [Spirochaetia bacterium]